jgi:hypothetical protein
MARMNRARLATRYRLLPGLVSGKIYRMTVQDTIATTPVPQTVNCIRFKGTKIVEVATEMGPSLQKVAEIHLYANELGNWVVTENDILHVWDEEQKLNSWWRIESVGHELLNTRANCMCKPTNPLE